MLCLLWLLIGSFSVAFGQAIEQSQLNFNGFSSINNGTALDWGPDGRLYVVEENGLVKVYTIQKVGSQNYEVTDAEVLSFVQDIPNHNDDGTSHNGSQRQVTGVVVGGSAVSPVVYVSSSDRRRGAGGGGGDVNLDTNSGVITRMTWNGTSWDVVDIVRGLPRSEENHATNGLELVDINGTQWMLVASGGFTNAGAPSNNFAYITEYVLAGCVLAVNLTDLESYPILNDGQRDYIYDIPTLDDPTRPNANGIDDPDTPGYDGIDVGDPWGGNDGLNQGMLVVGSPVQMFSPGYRNTYDLVVTQDGHVYVTDNGANGGWGGYPLYEATDSVSNTYRNGEPGSNGGNGNSEDFPPPPLDNLQDDNVNNSDHLNLVTTDILSYTFNSVYGGHPCPARANANAGLWTRGTHSDANGGLFFSDDAFRTQLYDPDGSTPGSTTDPEAGLPANWPPVDPALLTLDNADFRQPTLSGNGNPDGAEDIIVVNWGNNTNAIAEFTSTVFEVDPDPNAHMFGDLIAGKGGTLTRVNRDANGNITDVDQNFANVGGNALGITTQGDGEIFPGTIWVANYNGDDIVVIEPDPSVVCIDVTDPAYDPLADYDSDGYTNQEEIANGTDYCSSASTPPDFDGDGSSDLSDLDDDGDGINDDQDPLQLGVAFDLPIENELFLGQLGGYLGLGYTGLMNNGAPNPNYLDWQDDPDASTTDVNDILGGAIGAVTMYQTTGSALTNDQEKAYQMGVNVDATTPVFTAQGHMFTPLFSNTPEDFQAGESLGFFIGDGFQDDYLQIAMVSGFELTVTGESGGNPITPVPATDIGLTSASFDDLDLYFVIDPAAGTAQARYQIDFGTIVDLGGPITLTGNLLTAVQDANTTFVLGHMGTAASLDRVAGSWDFLRATFANPFVTTSIPDYNQLVGDADETLNLDDYFSDDESPLDLTYTIESNTDPNLALTLNGSDLTISFASEVSSTVTIRGTDNGGLFVEETFEVNVTDEPVPIIRLRTAGATLPATDAGNPDWIGLGTGGGTSPNGSFNGIDWAVTSSNTSTHDITGRDASVPAYVPQSLFANERWDPTASPEMQYTFALPNDNYTVRLYMGNGFSGTSAPGQRVFDILIEGQLVTDDLDLSATFGHQVGGMIEYQVSVSDGELNILFNREVENPTVNGIEILSASGSIAFPAITITNIPDQTNTQGDEPVLSVVASGGDPNENFSYVANGLPPGLSIEPTNGSILGTISTDPADAGTYNVEVIVDKPSSDADTATFDWTVTTGPSSAEALVEVIPGSNNLNASTFGSGSFVITNNSPSANITQVTYDMATGFLPNMVFDPNGTAGDLTAKGFTVNQGVGGTVGHTLTQPLGNGGFQGLEVTFDDFAPGETFTFSIDQDPTSVEGLGAPGPNDAGSVSGLEQAGTSVTVTFADGSTFTTTLYSDGSNAGATAVAKANLLAAPSIQFVGLNSPSTTNTASQTIQITGGPANGTVSLLQVEAGFFETTAGALSQEPFEVNSVIAVDRSTAISLDANGEATVSVTLTDSDPEAGYNYFLAAVEDGSGFGQTSNALIAEYDDQFVPPAPDSVLYRVNAAGSLTTATDTSGVDWEADQAASAANGSAATGTPSQYLDLTAPAEDITFGAALVAGTWTNNTGYPDALFEVERYSTLDNPDNMSWVFPVANGDYTVNLLFAEIWTGNQAVGGRIFDVQIEGQLVLDDFDQVAEYGWQTAGVESFTVNVTDGELNIDFFIDVQNPSVKAIEILSAGSAPTPNSAPVAVNPGTINSFEDDVITLPISATDADDCGGLTYSASGLPGSLSIDPATGVISGTIDGSTAGTTGAYSENGGLVIIEAEDQYTPAPGAFALDTTNGTVFLVGTSNHFGNAGAGQVLSYDIEINTPGVYRLQMKSEFSGTNATEENDSWVKFDNTTDVHYFCVQGGALSGTQEFVDFLNGNATSKNFFYPAGNAEGRPDHGNENPGSNGFFKIYRSGGGGNKWDGQTIDNNGFPVYAYFPNAGTYTMQLAERSAGHKVDRLALTNIDLQGTGEPVSVLDGPATQPGGSSGTAGASANSPYNVQVVVSDQCVPSLSDTVDFVWNVDMASTTGTPSALVQVTSGQGLGSSTFGNNSFLISNTGDVDITNISFNTTSSFMMDVVFDPVGTAGDNGAKCLTTGNAGNTAAQVGITVPANGGTDAQDCESVFTDPHNGIDNDEGYDGMNLDFTDFNGGEAYAFGVDMDPTSIKGDLTTGDAGSISGFELAGATVTITYADGTTHTTSLFDEGSIGGSDAILDANIPASAPNIAVSGNSGNQVVNSLSQTVTISGTPGASVTLLQVDGRLYIDPGNPNIGYDVDPFEANEAMAKVLYTDVVGAGGTVDIPVTLLQTTSTDAGPDGGINHFIAVENGPSGQNSLASNVIVLEYDPNAAGEALSLNVTLQGRSDHSTTLTVTTYAVGSTVLIDSFTVSSDAGGNATLIGLTAGTYQVKVKGVNHLASVETVTIAAGANNASFGELSAGDANNDNFVTSLDFSLLSSGFNSQSGDATFNAGADFNGDGFITSLDFSLLSSNFNSAGEEPSN